MRSAVATDTMSTGVKLWRETEELASFLVGNGNTAMRLCPFALLNSFERWDMVWTPALTSRCGDSSTPQDTVLNDCVHVLLSEGVRTDNSSKSCR